MAADCGTYAGYQAHRRNGEPACEDCKIAHAAYVARWRADNRRGAPRRRALVRLRLRHAAEYRALLRYEQARSDG